jgi:hypothetical protein
MQTRRAFLGASLAVAAVCVGFSGSALAQTGDVTVTDAASPGVYDVIVSIQQTGSTNWKLGMATFAFTFDQFAVQFESELEEGNWDNNRFPTSYGDQFPGRYTVTGARSIEIDFTGSNGSGVFLSMLPTVIGKLRFTVLDPGRSPAIRWFPDATAVFDDIGIDRTAGLTFNLATASGDEPGALPTTFELQQNYPNPFNPSTAIRYALPRESHVKLVVYNLVGEQVKVLVDEQQNAGYHTATFSASDLPSGMYVYWLSAGGTAMSRKMLLVK